MASKQKMMHKHLHKMKTDKESKNSHCKVYVGNISYTTTEEEMKNFLSIVGPVINFKFKYEKDTNKQQGYGFCEYADREIAMSALENLDGKEFQGRQLKVKHPNKVKTNQEGAEGEIAGDNKNNEGIDKNKLNRYQRGDDCV